MMGNVKPRGLLQMERVVQKQFTKQLIVALDKIRHTARTSAEGRIPQYI